MKTVRVIEETVTMTSVTKVYELTVSDAQVEMAKRSPRMRAGLATSVVRRGHMTQRMSPLPVVEKQIHVET